MERDHDRVDVFRVRKVNLALVGAVHEPTVADQPGVLWVFAARGKVAVKFNRLNLYGLGLLAEAAVWVHKLLNLV